MPTVAEERPTTAQERVLASNNPLPTPKNDWEPSHRQRAAANNRGSGVAGAFSVKPSSTEEAPQCHQPVDCHTSEFLAGPKEPCHVTHGVRRYDDRNVSMVGQALTEEWIRGRGEDDDPVRRTSRRRGPKDNLEGLCCSIKTEEAKQRRMRATGNAPPPTTMAPYSEPELPPQRPEATQPCGKRRFKTQSNADIFAPYASGGARADNACPRFHGNRANESVDVLNLGQYSPNELHEVERKIVAGPRQFVPPPLPPRSRPIIARVKTHANETHDIFGTGHGSEGTELVHRKNPGTCVPKRTDAANIFGTVVEAESQSKPCSRGQRANNDNAQTQRTDRQPPAAGTNVTKQRTAGEAASRQPQAKVETGMLFVSKSQTAEPCHKRATGMYAPKTRTQNIF